MKGSRRGYRDWIFWHATKGTLNRCWYHEDSWRYTFSVCFFKLDIWANNTKCQYSRVEIMLFDWRVNIFRWFTALAYCVQNVYIRFQDTSLFDPLIIHPWMQSSCQTLNNKNITIPVFYKLRARDLYYSLYNSYLLCLSNIKIQSLRSSMAMEEHDPDGYWQRESSCIDAYSSKYHSSFTWIWRVS